jgi:type I restriction enzyme S subunit
MYIDIPKTITYNDVIENNFSLSANQYKKLLIKNKNLLEVRDFLTRDLTRDDLGSEVGSINYIDKSPKYFLRTKALQPHFFLPEFTKESLIPIKPQVFKNMDLKEGDLIISKDSNIGEIVILDKDYPNIMLSGALYKLPVKDECRYYLLAFIKHQLFREQLDFIVPSGATIRHAKTLFLNVKIPMPNKNQKDTIKYISLLTKAIINKEKEIRNKHKLILEKIENELKQNQKPNKFKFSYPTFEEIKQTTRLDTGLYTREFKEIDFLIKNYKGGYKNIYELGFTLSRGQNLQISNIGKSIYSKKYYPNFYTLILPKFLSKYGTIIKEEFLGNKNNLKILKQGDLIFGAEGFEKGRSFVVIEDKEKIITNIHGITIKKQRNTDLVSSIFIKTILDFLRSKNIIEALAVGGNGGSLAQKYWDIISFPLFPEEKQKEISLLYHNPNINYDLSNATLDNFLEIDNEFNQKAGIYELDKTIKQLKTVLNNAIDKIANDEEVEIFKGL